MKPYSIEEIGESNRLMMKESHDKGCGCGYYD